ncbi:hypothetical protein LXA43DRAFT_892226 [Ganoderma leucocontextum]|nr:hypothetical protein LXA43DRAFT_892226 [Ganoderma leucocontextum]
MLLGLKHRFELLNVDDPWAVTVDNCCHFRNIIWKVFPDTAVLQDVWHMIMRYSICILGGTKNLHRAQVGEDISNALIKSRARNGIPASYWSQEEQEERLVRAYDKWAAVGGVWSAAAEKTHQEQLQHIRKGCLARPRDDVPTDGSRIEGTHKGWNALQCTHASGVEVLTNLAADHVLRHNIRVDHKHPNPYPFTLSTFGSHHVSLVNVTAKLWNTLLQPANKGQKRPPADLSPTPVLEPADSGEAFGLVNANADVTAYHSFVTVKEEPEDPLVDLSSQDPEDVDRIVASLGIDPTLLSRPLGRSTGCQAQSSSAGPPPPPTPRSLDMPQTIIDFTAASAPDSDPINVDADPINVDADATPPSSSAPIGSKKRPACTTLSRSQQEGVDSDKRPRLFHPDGPSSSSSSRPDPVSNSAPSTSSAPSTASPSTSLARRLPSFFSQCQLDPMPDPTATPICLPAPVITGQMRSQRIISAATGFDPRSLKFPKDDNVGYFLFMDLRAKYKWVTHGMTAGMWVEAASIYNAALKAKKTGASITPIIRKMPRALMEKLQEIESVVHHRKKNNDYKSRSGSMTFWEYHCNAVELVPGKATKGKGKNTTQTLSTRKPHTCHRCLSIMWAGGEGGGDNHKKGYCSDGVKQRPAAVDGITEELPLWPQPNEIFTKGTTFWPKRFTRTVRELYDTLIPGHGLGGTKAMEYTAFADMLQARLTVTPATADQPSSVHFKLYRGLTLGEQPERPSDLFTVDGVDYLHVSYLSEGGYEAVQAAGSGQAPGTSSA